MRSSWPPSCRGRSWLRVSSRPRIRQQTRCGRWGMCVCYTPLPPRRLRRGQALSPRTWKTFFLRELSPRSHAPHPHPRGQPCHHDTCGEQGSILLGDQRQETESAGALFPWWAVRVRFLLCRVKQVQTLPQGGSHGEPGLIGLANGTGQDDPEHSTFGRITMGTCRLHTASSCLCDGGASARAAAGAVGERHACRRSARV